MPCTVQRYVMNKSPFVVMLRSFFTSYLYRKNGRSGVCEGVREGVVVGGYAGAIDQRASFSLTLCTSVLSHPLCNLNNDHNPDLSTRQSVWPICITGIHSVRFPEGRKYLKICVVTRVFLNFICDSPAGPRMDSPESPGDAIFASLFAKLSVISRLILEAGQLHASHHLRYTCQRPHLQGREGRSRVGASPRARRKCKWVVGGDRPWCVSLGHRILRHYHVHDFRPRWAAVRTKLLSNPLIVRVRLSRPPSVPPRPAGECQHQHGLPGTSTSLYKRRRHFSGFPVQFLIRLVVRVAVWRPARAWELPRDHPPQHTVTFTCFSVT